MQLLRRRLGRLGPFLLLDGLLKRAVDSGSLKMNGASTEGLVNAGKRLEMWSIQLETVRSVQDLACV